MLQDPVNFVDPDGQIFIKLSKKFFEQVFPSATGKDARVKIFDKQGNDKGVKVFKDGRVVKKKNAGDIPQSVVDKARKLIPVVLVFFGDLFDPFGAIGGELDGSEDFDFNENGIPDWQEQFNNMRCQ